MGEAGKEYIKMAEALVKNKTVNGNSSIGRQVKARQHHEV